MGRLHLGVGTRYEREGRTFRVVQVLRDGRLVVEDQSGGGQVVVTREDITRAWEGGALRFAVGGSGVRAAGTAGTGALPTRLYLANTFRMSCRIGAGFRGQSAHRAWNSTPFHTWGWRMSPGILHLATSSGRRHSTCAYRRRS